MESAWGPLEEFRLKGNEEGEQATMEQPAPLSLFRRSLRNARIEESLHLLIYTNQMIKQMHLDHQMFDIIERVKVGG